MTPHSAFVNLATHFVMNVQDRMLMSAPAVKIIWSSALDLVLVPPTTPLMLILLLVMLVMTAVDNVLNITLQHALPARIISFFRTENAAAGPPNTSILQAIHVFPAVLHALPVLAQPRMGVHLAFQG